jgi:hypothetical protein
MSDDSPIHPPAPQLKRRSVVMGAALLAGLAPLQALQAAEPLEPDEEALFMPGTARPTDDGRIEVDIHAWIFERERRWGLDGALARYLGLNLKKLSPAARLRFNQRTALFHAESEEGKLIDVVFDGTQTRVKMPASTANGRTNLRVVVDAPRTAAPVQWLQFHGVTGPGELLHRFRGQALVVPPRACR